MKKFVSKSEKAFQDICYKGVLQVLVKMDIESHGINGIQDLRKRLKIIEKYDRLFNELIRSLVANKFLSLKKGKVRITKEIKMGLNTFNLVAILNTEVIKTSGYGAYSKLLLRCLQSFKAILQGEIDAINVIFLEGSMDLVLDVYSGNPQADYFNKALSQFVKKTVQNSIVDLKEGEQFTIMEIGAGTGGTSELLFNALDEYKDTIRYIYTDLSKSFLLHAENQYKDIAPYMETKLFNIENSPQNQGIEIGVCDLVIGANVIHATRNIAVSLNNIKAALKKNGVLLLSEIARTEIFTTITFGLLDGWWLFEDEQLRLVGSPGLSSQNWKKILNETGYININTHAQETLSQQIIVGQSDGKVTLLSPDQKRSKNNFPSASQIPKQEVPSVTAKGKDLSSFKGNADPAEIERYVREKLGGLLKLEPSYFNGKATMSDYGIDSILGLTLVKEINKDLKKIISITILFDYPTIETFTKYLLEEHSASFIIQKNLEEKKKESILDNPNNYNRITRPVPKRDITAEKLDTEHFENIDDDVVLIANQNRGWQLWLESPDTIDNIKLKPFKFRALKEGEVLVSITNFSLNFGDLLCVKGMYPSMPPYPFSPGFEASGKVQELGSNVSRFKSGDKVIVLADNNFGLHSSHAIVKESQLLTVPSNQSLSEACTTLVVGTAMTEVFRRLKYRKGDFILIQTATGGLGLIGIQLAQHYGLDIIATAGSEAKLEYLRDLGIEHVINYRKQDFEEEVKRISNGNGVSVVINTLSGENIQKGINCLGKRGQYVELSMVALKSANRIDLSKFSSNQSFIAFNLRELFNDDLVYAQGLWNECKALITSGVIKSTIGKEVSFAAYKEAYRTLEDRRNIGKVVVKVTHAHLEKGDSALMYRTAAGVIGDRSREMNIAIVGMSGQYGSAKDLNTFWQKLRLGESLIEEVPDSRWSSTEHYSPDRKSAHKTYSKWGSFLQGIDEFDPLFFRISGREAENMDPQQRLFLQHCWKALEDAGIPPEALNGIRCGVYVGATQGDYMRSGKNNDPSAFWGNSSSILASRISYYLNLKGPAIAIDTACSSSLVALDIGCKSLLNRETDIVISGGVTINTTPEFYKVASKAGMLSEDGKCYTFDHRSNGFVPGEGVGVLVLKRLEDAEKAGDPIYGIIKGIATNQDGATNGITAPSVKSQELLEREVYDTFNIDPETITYVEAHGTGTSLGDPIEFEALTKAFRNKTDKVQYCGLGSVKTNIGHTVYAAGVAAVQKILLSLKHNELPPSLNFEKANLLLNVANSPFYINTELKIWETENNQPRRAAASSFGFSGTNTHIVIEEYNKKSFNYKSSAPALILLSAKNEARLQEQAKNLEFYLQSRNEVNINDIAYTLQIGRESMEERLAFLAGSVDELVGQLNDYIQKKAEVLLSGNTKEHKNNFLLEEESAEAQIQTAISKQDTKALAELWIKGISIDWNLLYEKSNHPNKINLPTYPFARERYWISFPEIDALATTNKLHPLLHSNESNLNEQKYKSIYTGKESFFSDHIVNEEKILPGVAYLELALAAVEHSTEAIVTQIKDVAWRSPIRVSSNPKEVRITLYPVNEAVGFEILTGGSGEFQIHSQGKLLTNAQTPPSNYDLVDIRKQFIHSRDKETCYRLFKEIGLNYGSTFQGIEQLWYSDVAALSKITLPKEAGYKLPIGILDSALQTCLALGLDQGMVNPLLPFSVKEINIYKRFPETVWCYVTKSSDNKVDSNLVNYDIYLVNNEGEVLLNFRNFSALPLKNITKNSLVTEEGVSEVGIIEKKITKEEESIRLHFYSNDWVLSPKVPDQKIYDSQLILLAEGSVYLADLLKEKLAVEVETVDEETEIEYFLSVFNNVREKLETNSVVGITVVYENRAYHEYGFVSGLLKSAMLENPKLTGKIVGVDSLSTQNFSVVADILEAEQGLMDTEVRYINGKREAKVLRPIPFPIRVNDSEVVKEEGVYLITGGTGGLGQIFTDHIGKIKDTKVILVGRSALTKDKEALLKPFSNVTYYACDVSIAEEVSALIRNIKKVHGKLDGIIHSTGILRDGMIIKKAPEEVQLVLNSKIAGVKNLDEATKGEALDFMVFFSSIAGVLGNIGQSDYASANAYLDNYALYREEERSRGMRQGRTLCINWPQWKEGGMLLNENIERYLEKQRGMVSLPTLAGISAFDQLLNSELIGALVAYGKEIKITETFLNVSSIKEKGQNLLLTDNELDKLKEASIVYLRTFLTAELRLPQGRLALDEPFENYGIDSVLIFQLNTRLEEVFDTVPITLFFEYRTLEELADYFVAEHAVKMQELTGIGDVPLHGQKPEYDEPLSVVTRKQKRFIEKDSTSISILPGTSANNKDIAVIGLSGRYPGAKNIEEFWNNLKNGVDSITEIPKDRWEIRGFYDKEKGKPGKSYSKWGGFLDDIDKFDPLFFNISPREAELMDPQERLFIETVWQAIEDAGYTRKQLQGSKTKNELGNNIAIYAGVMYEEYQLLGVEERIKGKFAVPGGVPSSIANRASYFFNFHGPSMAVDTMCSSSLTAIDLACQSIRNGTCEAAIAGGVNISVHPNKYLFLSQSNFVSSSGRCTSFGSGGDGYVPSEGVGVVLLKSLSKAEADGDRIYGVIKGSAINHGGKTSGLTVPNPKAQTAVIIKAMEKAGVKAEDFSYIEAHGTGTSLGDPIEMAGLTKAFQSNQRQFCSIGSVKSNIGHAESAAGISGVTKVLLQFKYKKLAPSLHTDILNPNIDFEKSPFKVQQTLEEWETEDGKPRLAGISSFGAGGSNAHVIIEEYTPKVSKPYKTDAPAIILLSAKGEDRLKEQVVNLRIFLENNKTVNLYDVAYTLQIGREAMEERLAFVSDSLEELTNHLIGFEKGQTEGLSKGNIEKDNSDFVLDGKAGEAYLRAAIENKEGKSLSQLWAKGVSINWELLYEKDNRPNKIGLPTYPFARERYWISELEGLSLSTLSSQLHPLLHSNESDLEEQKYRSVFTGRETFLLDHKIRGEKVFPGAAYLELAREAGKRSLNQSITQLKDIIWLSPIWIKDKSKEIQISLCYEEGLVDYEIYSLLSGDAGDEIVHAQGKLSTEPLIGPSPFNIVDIKARLMNNKQGSDCYTLFKKWGIDYGISFRGIEMLYYSDEESLSKITLPNEVDYILQPGIIDSALQTCIGLSFGREDALHLPFSVREINIYGAVDETSWCYARRSIDNNEDSKVTNFDIDLLSETGLVLLSFRDFATLPLDGLQHRKDETTAQEHPAQEEVSLHLYTTDWEGQIAAVEKVGSASKYVILLAGGSVRLAEELSAVMGAEIISVNEDTEIAYYNKVQEVIQSKLKEKERINLTVLYRNTNYIDYGFISGVLKTATLEHPKVTGKTIGVEILSIKEKESLMDILRSEEGDSTKEVRYIKGKREVRRITTLPTKGNLSPKEGGVYLITGGSGGIGRIFANYLSGIKDTELILTGRSKKSGLTGEELREINASYHSCDVTQKESVEALINSIIETYGKLDGIIHSAGVIEDSFLLTKTKEDSTRVLSPKIQGAKYLGQATEDIDLDFTVYFSSVSGVTGNLGQGDYASANAWLDNYAQYRNNLRKEGKIKGHTLSINWPLWEAGGMQLDQMSKKILKQTWGIHPLPKREGIKAFEQLLNSKVVQGIVIYGNPEAKNLFANLNGKSIQNKEKYGKSTEVKNEMISFDTIVLKVKQQVQKTFKIPIEQLELEKDFVDYGGDSILFTKMVQQLNTSLGISLTAPTLFEYRTIKELTNYIIQEHNPDLQDHESLFDQGNLTYRNRKSRKISKTEIPKEDYAIVAASGRFTSADTAEEFWHKIEKGVKLELPHTNGQGSSPSFGRLSMENYQNGLPGLNLEPSEILQMSAQEKLVFKALSKAMADYSISREDLSSKTTGVFIGAQQVYEESKDGTTTLAYLIPNKVSFYLNLKGPSEVVNTYCTSVYVAIHRAIQSIAAGDCEQAIVGGVNVISEAEMSIVLDTEFGSLFSQDGRTKSFGDDAQGFVRSEGVGIMIIKPLNEAEKAGNRILGLIKGSSIFHGGKGFSLEAPSAIGIKKTIEASLAKSEVDVDTIDYIEAHGIANPMADAIELAAIDAAYKKSSKDPKKKWHISSIKPTIGHSELASGMASLLKVLKAFEHKTIPGIPGLEKVNSELDPNNSLILRKESMVWKNGSYPRRAALNSYAVGGMNAHIILEEYLQKDDRPLPITFKPKTTFPLENITSREEVIVKQLPVPVVIPPRSETPLKDGSLYDVIVIGAGIAGLISACYLAKQGKQVLILEAHNIPGGYLQNYYRKGFEVDAVSAVIPDPHNTPIFKQVFADLDIQQEWISAPLSQNRIDRLGNFYSYAIKDVNDTGLSKKEVLISTYLQVLPEYQSSLQEMFEEMFDEEKYAQNFNYYINLTLGEFLAKFLPERAHHFFYHPFVNPTEVKGDSAYLPFKEFLKVQVATTQYYPKGSWKKLIGGLVKKFKEYGGIIKFKHCVEGFKAEGKEIRKVITERSSFKAKSVLICGSPYPLLTKVENSGLQIGTAYLDKLAQRTPCAPSVVLTAFFEEKVIQKLTPQEQKLLHGMVFFEEESLSKFQNYFDTEQLYIICPTSLDASLSEKGDYFVATNTVKYISEDFWKNNKPAVQEHFQKLFFTAFPSLKGENCRFELATPLTIERFTLNYKGAISGWAMTPDQIGENTLSHKTPWENLFLAGHWVFPGPRIPFAMESAISAVFEVARYLEIVNVNTKSDTPSNLAWQWSDVNRQDKFQKLLEGILEISMDEIKLDSSLFEYDFGSIKLMRFVRAINEEFGIQLKMGQILSADNFQSVFHLFESEIEKTTGLKEGSESTLKESYPERYPLSEGQKGLWFIQESEPANTAYNLPIVACIDYRVDADTIYDMTEQLMHEHPILRVTFDLEASTERLFQKIQPASGRLKRDIQELDKDQDTEQVFRQLLHKPFDLSQEVMRLHVREDKSKKKLHLLFVIHHIVSDALSNLLFFSSFLELFDQLTLGKGSVQTTSDKSYFDFIDWESDYIESKEGTEDLNYWRDKFRGNTSKLKLPYDTILKDTIRKNVRDGIQRIELTGKQFGALKLAAKSMKVNLSVFMLSAFKILLYKLSNTEDIIITMPTAGRPKEKYERSIGYYINMMLSRTLVSDQQIFSDLIKGLQSEFISNIDHVRYPFPKLLTILNHTEGNAADYFQVTFNYNRFFNDAFQENDLNGLQFINNIQQEITNEYTMDLIEHSDRLILQLKFRKDLFLEKSIKRHLGYYTKILDEIVTNPQIIIGNIDILSDKEKTRLLTFSKGPKVDYSRDKTIFELFQAQVSRTPNSIALVYEGEELSYQELNDKSNQLARYIRVEFQQRLGTSLEADTLIALCLERSLEMVIGILGVLKAGGAYVPIDPSYPQDRLEYILEDTAAPLILCQRGLLESGQAQVPKDKVICIDLSEGFYKREDSSNLSLYSCATDLAYVIYTSGTTGKPKGVMVEHSGIVNRLEWMQSMYPLNSQDVVLQKTPYGFDVSVWELIWANWYGAKIILAKPDGHKDSKYLHQSINKNEVTTIHFVPSMLEAYNQYLIEQQLEFSLSLKRIFCSGEALNENTVQQAYRNSKNRSLKLHNLYGPTEASIDVTFFETSLNTKVYIGRPIQNTQAYVLNKYLTPVPVGVIGELYIGGAGLARGYLNDEALTSERFVPNPFIKDLDRDKEYTRLYKTGDLVRWSTDGDLEYLGRNDNQVKIRGYRIELGEIELVLSAVPGIRQSCILVKERDVATGSSKYLVGYYIADGSSSLSDNVIIDWLSKVLPEYMIPMIFMKLESFPLNINGKLDKPSLPDPDFTGSIEDYIAPNTDIEELLCTIWKDVLGLERVGVTDDFFRIGGDSILSIRLVSRIQQLGFNITVRDILKNRNIRDISKDLTKNTTKGVEYYSPFSLIENEIKDKLITENNLDPEQIVDIYPASYLQTGMLIESLLKSSVYHDVFSYEINSEFIQIDFESIWIDLVAKNEQLRTVFIKNENGYLNIVYNSILIDSKIEVLSPRENLEKFINTEKYADFDIESPGLFRLFILPNNSNKNFILIFSFHHAITDGWSIISLISKFSEAYLHAKIFDTDSQPPYGKFIFKEQAALRNNIYSEFWLEYLSGYEIETNNLYVKSDLTYSNEQVIVSKKLGSELSQRILDLAKSIKISPDIIFLGVYNLIMSIYYNTNDWVLGVVVNNRLEEEGGDRVFGLHLNTIPIRLKTNNSNESIRDYLLNVFNNKLKIDEYKIYPYGKMKSDLNLQEDIYKCAYNYLHFHIVEENNDEDSINMGIRYEKTNIPMVLNVLRIRETFNLEFNCENEFIDYDTVEQILEGIIFHLEQLTSNSFKSIKDYKLLSPATYDEIVNNWNATDKEYASGTTIYELFQAQVAKNPDRLALVYEGEELSYQALNEKSNQVARHIREEYQQRIGASLDADTLIALCLERSLEMVIGILGVLKAGGAYVPLDPGYPQDRLEYILDDTGALLILSQRHLVESGQAPLPEAMVVYLDLSEGFYNTEDSSNLPKYSNATDLAYVIYTSGSTGKPKGVMIEHHGFINMITYLNQEFNVTAEDRTLQFASITFDVSIYEVFMALLSGANLVILPEKYKLDINLFIEFLEDNKITIATLTPAYLGQLPLDRLPSIKTLISAGEALGRSLARRIKNIPNLINAYGPTEVSVCSSFYKIIGNENGVTIPIGSPIQNISFYILNRDLNPVPIGVIGELHIGGAGLARGYLNNEELTKEKFIPHPFKKGERIYKTGDLARWLMGGNIEFLGRIDHQLKVRGYRIEPGEIAFRLNQHEHVKESVVIGKQMNETIELVAYVIPEKNKIDLEALRAYLQKCLPNYMTPLYWMELESFPLTSSGKLDRKALPDPLDSVVNENRYVPAKNKTEESLVQIWQDVLGIKKTGIQDNFFDLGGHSLNALKVVNKINLELSPSVSLRDLFAHPTIADLARSILQNSNDNKEADKFLNLREQNTEKMHASDHLKIESKSLLSLIATGSIPPVEGVALSYIPDSFLMLPGINHKVIIDDWFGNMPLFMSIDSTHWGRIGSIVLPIFNSEVYDKKEQLDRLIVESLRLSKNIGAKVVSLTGLLPSATDYGRGVIKLIENEKKLPEITTGHATTSASVILSIKKILSLSGRSMSEETVGYIGLGSIGSNSLRLMLSCLPHPSKIILCDLYTKSDLLDKILCELRDDLGYQGKTELVKAKGGRLPQRIYEASLMIGATNAPEVLDVDKLKPGTLIVDDSGPHCFSTEKAIQRFELKKDILFTEGGALKLPFPFKRMINIPEKAKNYFPDGKFPYLDNDSYTLMGCTFSSVLSANNNVIIPTIGDFDVEISIKNYELLLNLEIEGAELHCGNYILDKTIISSFRDKYSIGNVIDKTET